MKHDPLLPKKDPLHPVDIILVIMLLGLLFWLTGCGGGEDPPPKGHHGCFTAECRR
jgi:hypothetical protein